VTGDLRKVHTEELDEMRSSHDIFRVIKSRRLSWEGNMTCMREKRNVFRILVGKPAGKTPGRSWCKLEYNI
jgi:hypothetical protein